MTSIENYLNCLRSIVRKDHTSLRLNNKTWNKRAFKIQKKACFDYINFKDINC